jgi:hypothetical protein
MAFLVARRGGRFVRGTVCVTISSTMRVDDDGKFVEVGVSRLTYEAGTRTISLVAFTSTGSLACGFYWLKRDSCLNRINLSLLNGACFDDDWTFDHSEGNTQKSNFLDWHRALLKLKFIFRRIDRCIDHEGPMLRVQLVNCDVWLINKCRQGSKTNKSNCQFWNKLIFDLSL